MKKIYGNEYLLGTLGTMVQSGRTDTEEQETVSEVVAPEEVLTVGSAVGEQMADFTVETVGGGNFHLLEQRGRVTMINLWATYCGPCVQELPHAGGRACFCSPASLP